MSEGGGICSLGCVCKPRLTRVAEIAPPEGAADAPPGNDCAAAELSAAASRAAPITRG